jgi:hypothetical protein
MTGLAASGNLHPVPNYPVMRGGQMASMPFPEAYGGNFAAPVDSTSTPIRQQRLNPHPQVPDTGGQEFETSFGQNAGRYRQIPSVTRRESQEGQGSQSSGNTSYDLT